jgi:hypothetical protein
MDYAEAVSTVALSISFINLVLYYWFFSKTAKASITSSLADLPPYKNEDQETTITIKNVGTAGTTLKEIFLTFSWDKDLKLSLFQKQKKEKICLFPNEEMTFRKKLPKPPSEKNEYIKVTTRFDNWTKEEDFPIRVSKGFVFGSFNSTERTL